VFCCCPLTYLFPGEFISTGTFCLRSPFLSQYIESRDVLYFHDTFPSVYFYRNTFHPVTLHPLNFHLSTFGSVALPFFQPNSNSMENCRYVNVTRRYLQNGRPCLISAARPLLRRRGRGSADGADQGLSRYHFTQGDSSITWYSNKYSIEIG
jgi:hypothetical protein